MRGLIIGRFQPFHKGHLSVIEQIARQCDSMIIGIGSAQYSHTSENPFTAGERYLMLSRTLERKRISNYYIVPIQDVNRYDVWVSHVESLVPRFKAVFTNNPLTRQLFLERDYKVIPLPFYDRKVYSGREVRKRMILDEDWRALLPRAVAEVIDECNGIERLKTLAGTDVYTLEDEVAKALFENKRTIAVAESCTGGLLSNLLTSVPNASEYFVEGMVVYSDAAKHRLGVSEKVIEAFGAVSAQTATEMAKKIRKHSNTDIGVGITGFAGPGGAPGEVGRVYIALASKSRRICRAFRFSGSRDEVKDQAAKAALGSLKEHLAKNAQRAQKVQSARAR